MKKQQNNSRPRVITNQQYLAKLSPMDAAYLIKWIYISHSYMRDTVTSRTQITEWLQKEVDVKEINNTLKKMKEGEV